MGKQSSNEFQLPTLVYLIVTFALIYRMELVKYTVKNPLLDTTFKKVFLHPKCMVSLLSSIYEETVQYVKEHALA